MNSPSAKAKSTGSPDVVRRKCNCRNSRCLKLYCECFANGNYCGQDCNCKSCCNNPEHESRRKAAIGLTLERNPEAFRPKIATSPVSLGKAKTGQTIDGETTINDDGKNSSWVRQIHHKGCHCKKSHCLKRYCECFQANILCSEKCKCTDCKNFEGSAYRLILEAEGQCSPAVVKQLLVDSPDGKKPKVTHQVLSSPPPDQTVRRVRRQRYANSSSKTKPPERYTLLEQNAVLSHLHPEAVGKFDFQKDTQDFSGPPSSIFSNVANPEAAADANPPSSLSPVSSSSPAANSTGPPLVWPPSSETKEAATDTSDKDQTHGQYPPLFFSSSQSIVPGGTQNRKKIPPHVISPLFGLLSDEVIKDLAKGLVGAAYSEESNASQKAAEDLLSLASPLNTKNRSPLSIEDDIQSTEAETETVSTSSSGSPNKSSLIGQKRPADEINDLPQSSLAKRIKFQSIAAIASEASDTEDFSTASCSSSSSSSSSSASSVSGLIGIAAPSQLNLSPLPSSPAGTSSSKAACTNTNNLRPQTPGSRPITPYTQSLLCDDEENVLYSPPKQASQSQLYNHQERAVLSKYGEFLQRLIALGQRREP